MNANELRQKYLDFFAARDHQVISSASLIPENDSTLLFTNSGMFPLVPYFLGTPHPAGNCLANSQKCFRTEDIDEVGDARHNTFFEMLGNWSLGDYFKKEQLHWWFEFLIEKLNLDPRRIYQTVYAGDGKNIGPDNEAISILQEIYKKYGLSAEVGPATLGKGELGSGLELDFTVQRIFPYRDKNWWKRGEAVGELGGPDSETFFDTGQEHDPRFGPYCHPNCDCGRFLEIGNSVFMQYQKTSDGWRELASKNVDFGGGLERLLMVLEKQNSIFNTDLFSRIIKQIEVLSGRTYPGNDENRAGFEVVADHIKAATFLIGDPKGIAPSNTDQGYVIRRLLRRAIRYGRKLGIEKNLWLQDLAAIVINDYSSVYPELSQNQNFIFSSLNQEEEKFERSLEKGLKELDRISSAKENALNGADLFHLYQSFGFPLELSLEELANRACNFSSQALADIKQLFNEELKKHQELSRTAAAGKFKGGLADSSEQTTRLHTAAHLLLAALRKVLGEHVVQKGSNITPERLRLDFSHPEKMTPEQIKQVEDLVNQAIDAEYDVFCQEMPLGEAKERGAMGVFESKYGEQVKVYGVGKQEKDGLNKVFSYEICGGPHVNNTRELGKFSIQKEEASSAGVRRIKAILG
ncbi:MAG: alanine--tRNA ligase-related protein [Patescibacteria group bacterium]